MSNTIGSDIYNYFKNGGENFGPIAILINSGLVLNNIGKIICSWSRNTSVSSSWKLIKVKFDEKYFDYHDPCKYHCVAITGIKPAGFYGLTYHDERYEVKNYAGKEDKHKYKLYIPVNMPFLQVMHVEFNRISYSFKSVSLSKFLS